MTPLFRKLNLKDHAEIVVLNAPESFESELKALGHVRVQRSVDKLDRIAFAIAFVTREAAVDAAVALLSERLEGDAVLWFAYPKKSSKRYESEIDRDHGWEVVGEAGFEPVRQVAIDEDWSALRFRRTDFIKKMTRGEQMRLSPHGRARGTND